MGKLGGALLVLGFLLSLSFFFGMALVVMAPSDVDTDAQFNENMHFSGKVGGVSLVLTALGVVMMGAGGVILATNARRRLAR